MQIFRILVLIVVLTELFPNIYIYAESYASNQNVNRMHPTGRFEVCLLVRIVNSTSCELINTTGSKSLVLYMWRRIHESLDRYMASCWSRGVPYINTSLPLAVSKAYNWNKSLLETRQESVLFPDFRLWIIFSLLHYNSIK